VDADEVEEELLEFSSSIIILPSGDVEESDVEDDEEEDDEVEEKTVRR